MPPEHVLYPSKTQRIAPTEESSSSNNASKVASTFGDMTPQIIQAHKTSAYFTDKNGDETKLMEGETLFSPIGRYIMSYDINDTNAEDDEGVTNPTF
jgi:hypothetical protein